MGWTATTVPAHGFEGGRISMNDHMKPDISWLSRASLPSVIVLAAIIYTAVTFIPPLASTRPLRSLPNSPDASPHSEFTAPLPLWEDPLKAVYERASNEESSQKKPKTRPLALPIRKSENTLILPVMLRGGGRPADVESRIRQRYAVIAGLTTALYEPSSSAKMQHFQLCLKDDAGLVSRNLLIPYEIYRPVRSDRAYDDEKDPLFEKVLVLWIDSERLLPEKPLLSLKQVVYGVINLFDSRDSEPGASKAKTKPRTKIGNSDKTKAPPKDETERPQKHNSSSKKKSSDPEQDTKAAVEKKSTKSETRQEDATPKKENPKDTHKKSTKQKTSPNAAKVQPEKKTPSREGETKRSETKNTEAEKKAATPENESTSQKNANRGSKNTTCDEKDKPSYCVVVLGPSSSDQLLVMAKEAERLEAQSCTCGSQKPSSCAGCKAVRNRRSLVNEHYGLNWGMRHHRTCPVAHCTDPTCCARRWYEILFKDKHLTVRFLNARATLEPGGIKDAIEPAAEAFTERLPRPEKGRERNPCCPEPRTRFTNVIGTDWHLVWALVRELEARGKLSPASESSSEAEIRDGGNAKSEKGKAENECIVLITERDTIYGAAIPFLFRLAIPKGPSVVVFNYLSGVDGRALEQAARGSPSSRDRTRADTTSAANGGSSAEDDARNGFAPDGPSQLDYLRRLEARLVDLDLRMRRKGGRGVVAVGVVGSDVYDKLLVLRALRQRFRNAVFFTTDLEAEYYRKSELPYTQNLIVASHFGLTLNPWLQRDVPPFRESYQTSTFLATLLAVREYRVCKVFRCEHGRSMRATYWPRPERDANAEPDWAVTLKLQENPYPSPRSIITDDELRDCLCPLVFEISAGQAYQLTPTWADPLESPSSNSPRVSCAALVPLVHPAGNRRVEEAPWRIAAFFLGLLMIAGVAAKDIRVVRAIPATMWRAGEDFMLALLRHPEQDAHGRGESSTTAEFQDSESRYLGAIRVILVGTAIACLPVLFVPLTFFILDRRTVNGTPEPWMLIGGASVWPSVAIWWAVVLIAIGALAVVENRIREQAEFLRSLNNDAGKKKEASESGDRGAGAARISAREILRRTITAPSDGLRHLRAIYVERWLHLNEPSWDTVVALHRRVTLGTHRWARILVEFAGLSLGFAALFYFQACNPFTSDNIPARSEWARFAGAFTLLVATACYLLLALAVVDLHLLIYRFLRHLQRVKDVPIGSLPSTKNWRRSYGHDPQVELSRVRLVGAMTRDVGKIQKWVLITGFLIVSGFSKLLDGWNLDLALVVMLAMPSLGIIGVWVALRRAAHEVREQSLRQLREHWFSRGESFRPILQRIARDVVHYQQGALKPVSQDYLLGAISFPIAGMALLALVKWLWLV